MVPLLPARVFQKHSLPFSQTMFNWNDVASISIRNSSKFQDPLSSQNQLKGCFFDGSMAFILLFFGEILLITSDQNQFSSLQAASINPSRLLTNC